MPKRQQRTHLELDQVLPAPVRPQPRTDINLHAGQHSHRPDPHRERKRMRRELHLIEGWAFDDESTVRLDDIA